MSKKNESSRSWISFGLTAKPVLTECKSRKSQSFFFFGDLICAFISDDLHAKLVYAEALLIRALLTFIQDQGLFNFISGALKIKECHDLFM
jgi:hypothetical protein